MNVYQLIQALSQYPADAKIKIFNENIGDYENAEINVSEIAISGKDIEIAVE